MARLSHKGGKISSKILNFLPVLEGYSTRLVKALKEPILGRFFEWCIVGFGVGVALYYTLPFEPTHNSLIALGAVILCLLFARNVLPDTVKYSQYWRLYFIAAMVFLGFGRGYWHTHSVATVFLPEVRQTYTVTGWVETLEPSGTRLRWQVRVKDLSSRWNALPPDSVPQSVRVRITPGEFVVGDYVTFKAMMTAPPGPVIAQGYDPARRAYFNGLGGYGFAISNPTAADEFDLTWTERLSRLVAIYRYKLAAHIHTVARPSTAGLQVALLTGVRTYIPPEQVEMLRIAGLAHVLAISGLHMGLLSGGAFFMVTLILACITPLSRRYDVRKFAAVMGALTATAYLILSGGSVSTQRAYIMAVIVFLAVILDRRAFSIRSIACAALITLFIHPESLLSVGFQMSFSAATALIVFYGFWQKMSVGVVGPKSVVQKFSRNLWGLTMTSLIAGTATSVFAMLHFNRFAKYSLIGNIFAMPIFSAIVMPAALAVLVLLPFGLEAAPLYIMGKGLEVVLWVAGHVAAIDGAMLHVSVSPNWVVATFGIAFVVLCLGRYRLKIISLGLMGLCYVGWVVAPQPDLRISNTGKVAFWGNSDDILYVDNRRGDKYGREQFLQQSGIETAETMPLKEGVGECDALGCHFLLKERLISLANTPDALLEDCAYADIIIYPIRAVGSRQRRLCKAMVIDVEDLKVTGAQNIYITENTITVKTALTAGRRRRPWAYGYNRYVDAKSP